jgi:hypothetical protein
LPDGHPDFAFVVAIDSAVLAGGYRFGRPRQA